MIKFVDENGMGFTAEDAKAVHLRELADATSTITDFITIEEAMKKSIPVTVWSEDDGDGNLLSLEAHHAGFLVSINGDNYLKDEYRLQDQAYVSTWFGFEMLEEIMTAMKEHAHLVDGKGYFKKEVE